MFDLSYVPNNSANTREELLLLQQKLAGKIRQYDTEIPPNDLWCFMQKENAYYFFYLEKDHPKDDPVVHIFVDLWLQVDNGWNSEYGSIEKKEKFTKFINDKTEEAFGRTPFKNILRYFLMVLGSPFYLFLYLDNHFWRRRLNKKFIKQSKGK